MNFPSVALPVRLAADLGSVVCADFGGEDFADPWFDQAVERLPKPLGYRISTEDLLAVVESERVEQPELFVFHSGRCGSTLLANMFSRQDDVRVIKEADPVTGAAIAAARQDLHPAGTIALRAVIGAYGRAAGRPGPRLVIKFSSPDLKQIQVIHEVFPSTPVLILWRHPSQVVDSELAGAPEWRRRERTGDRAADIEFYTKSWLELMAEALEFVTNRTAGVRLQEYLSSATWGADAFRGANELLARPLPQDRLARSLDEASAYSKDRSRHWPNTPSAGTLTEAEAAYIQNETAGVVESLREVARRSGSSAAGGPLAADSRSQR